MNEAVEGAGGWTAVDGLVRWAQVPPPQERPIDLFKAIFEAEDEEEDEDEEEEEEPEVGPPPPADRAAAGKPPTAGGWSAAAATGKP